MIVAKQRMSYGRLQRRDQSQVQSDGQLKEDLLPAAPEGMLQRIYACGNNIQRSGGEPHARLR
jgi:hypothetical protein